MNKPIIGIDFNGCLSHDWPIWVEEVSKKDDICNHPKNWRDKLIKGLYPDKYEGPWDICSSCFGDIFLDPAIQALTTPKGNISRSLTRLKKFFNIFIVTALESDDSMANCLMEWCFKNKIYNCVNGLILGVKDKGKWCSEAGAMFFVEDSPGQILSINKQSPGTCCFVIDYPYNKEAGISFRVNTLEDVANALCLDQEPTILGRA